MSRAFSTKELLDELFEDKQYPLITTFTRWLTSSKRFRVFAETYRTKIRAKMRATRDPESLRDLAFELEAAYWLLQEPRLSITYEQRDISHTRRPDFSVTFTTK